MKKVFIKYNPYKLETEITVNGDSLKENSVLRGKSREGCRLQEWVEELPQLLYKEYNDKDFDITFHGTLLDFEDVKGIIDEACKSGMLNKVEDSPRHVPAKEVTDKEKRIDEIFEKIQNGPIEDLRSPDLVNAFKGAKNKDFKICVVATMSSGKSTLINAMLGTKLMPSKQEACTAIITGIKDIDAKQFSASVYNYDSETDEKKLLETHERLTLADMERLNSNENVSEIRISGNIPFVASDEISLILIDTPGPNNSRDEKHGRIQSKFLSDDSKALILYIMTGEFGTEDDNKLLKRVSDSMKIGGKQSKDRFIFVVNKLDGRKKEDGDLNVTLERVRSYLRDHGVENPNLFPAAALPALNIRLIQKNDENVDEDTRDDTELMVKKLNRNDFHHFEKYSESSLPPSVRKKVKSNLEKAQSANDNLTEALIHTGIPSVEETICQYVYKYAKTHKIKLVVDTFKHKLYDADNNEKLKHELATQLKENEEEVKKIVEQINEMESEIASGKNAEAFEENVSQKVDEVKTESGRRVDEIIKKYQEKVTECINGFRGTEITPDEADSKVENLKEFAKTLEPEFRKDVDELIRDNLITTSKALLDQYKEKLSSLTKKLSVGDDVGIKEIDPSKLMSGAIVAQEISVKHHMKKKTVEEKVWNLDKAWYKPWTWFEEEYYWHREDEEFVDLGALAADYFKPAEAELRKGGENARKHVRQESERILKYFWEQFKLLDNELRSILDNLKEVATNKDEAEKNLKESQYKIEWLEKISKEVESILEI